MPRFEDVTLQGDGFVLRPCREKDIRDITVACQDDLIQAWLPLPYPYTEAAARSFVTEVAPHVAETGDGLKRAIDVDGRLHGVIDFKQTKWRSRETEIGYWVAPWGRGQRLAGRATRLWADWALTTQGIERVTILAAAGNVASQRAALAAGFQREGVKRCAGITHDGRVDLVMFGKIRVDL